MNLVSSFVFFAGLCFLAGSATVARGQEAARLACRHISGARIYDRRPADLSKFQPASKDIASYPYLLKLRVHVYKQEGGLFSTKIDEEELSYHLERARNVYHKCGIEIAVEGVRFLDGPDELEDLERVDPNTPRMLSPDERCLFSTVHVPGEINLYFVPKASNSGPGNDGSHAYNVNSFKDGEYSQEKLKRFVGSAVITDSALRFGNPQRKLVMAHEIGHVLLNMSRHCTECGDNLMRDTLVDSELSLTEEQCRLARQSPFVEKRAFPVAVNRNEAEANRHCGGPDAVIDPSQTEIKKVCAGEADRALQEIAYCDSARSYVNPFAITMHPELGTPACRYLLLKVASQEAQSKAKESDPVLSEGSALFVYEDCKTTPRAVGMAIPDLRPFFSQYTSEPTRYCEKIMQNTAKLPSYLTAGLPKLNPFKFGFSEKPQQIKVLNLDQIANSSELPGDAGEGAFRLAPLLGSPPF